MDAKIKSWLYDIQKAITEIEFFSEGRTLIIQHYQEDIMFKRAVERNLEIIGEAMNRILNKDDKIALSYSYNIIGTRNRIIHAYDDISDETILEIIVAYLPILKSEINLLLADN